MLLRSATTRAALQAVGLTAAALSLYGNRPRPGQVGRSGAAGRRTGIPPAGTKDPDEEADTRQLPPRSRGPGKMPAPGPAGREYCAWRDRASRDWRSEFAGIPTGAWHLDRLLTDPQYWARFLRSAAAASSSKSGDASSQSDSNKSSANDRRPGKAEPPASGDSKKSGGDDRRDEGGSAPADKDAAGFPVHLPVCCACNRGGVSTLAPAEDIHTDTFVTRRIGPGQSPKIGLCLMPTNRGLVVGRNGQRRCGHTPCARCTQQVQGQYMCPCCAVRTQAQGSALQGAGPMPARQSGARAPPAEGRSTAGLPLDLREAPAVELRRAPDIDRRQAGPGGHRAPTPPSPRRISTRRRRHPTERSYRSASEQSSERESIQEEVGDATGRDPPGEGRLDGPAHGEGEPGEDIRAGDSRPKRKPEARSEEWCMVCNERRARENGGTCCGACEDTGGMEHTTACDRREGRTSPPPTRRPRPPPGGGDEDGDEPGGGKGKGKPDRWPTKKAAKAARDRERGRQRREKWRAWKTAAFPSAAYNRALDMGTAPSTRKAYQTRLRTWDMAVARLQREGLLGEGTGGHRMNGRTALAGVAFLKAKGYRSAELYLSAAMRRHRLTHRVNEPLTQATQDAIRLAKRGRGPPRKRQPMPFPKTDHPAYPALATGIWFLLRVAELKALNVGDVVKKQGPDGWVVGLTIRTSKTDQEAQSTTIARECLCDGAAGAAAQELCPACILWRQVSARSREMRAIGQVQAEAPLFTSPGGERMTERAVMNEVESVAKAAGEPLMEGDRPRFGTHSMRVAGAIIAFQAGLEENTIKALGRWESTRAMLGYLRGIPYIRAAGATKHMARALTGGQCGLAAVEVLRPIWADMTGRSLAARVNAADHRAGGETVEDGPQVRHCLTGLLHRSGVLRGPPESWSTRCGWKWADLGVAGDFGTSSLCSKCYGNK